MRGGHFFCAFVWTLLATICVAFKLYAPATYWALAVLMAVGDAICIAIRERR